MTPAKFTLYKYFPMHWAIDCETCNRKITNLTPNDVSGEIIDKLLRHEKLKHADT